MQTEFTAFARAQEGRGANRRLRRSGRTPGIVYGGESAPQSIELDHNALIHALKKETFHSTVLTMQLDGQSHQVLLRDVQMHPFRNEVQHLDFQRVDANRKITMKVPLHFINADISPAVKTSGAIISHVLTEINVNCLPRDLPEFLEVDLSELAAGHSIHLADLKVPEGVTAGHHGRDNPVVATAVVPRAMVEAEVTNVQAAVPEAEAGKKEEKPAAKKEEKSGGKKDDKK